MVWSWVVSVKVFGGCLLEVAVELLVGCSSAFSIGVWVCCLVSKVERRRSNSARVYGPSCASVLFRSLCDGLHTSGGFGSKPSLGGCSGRSTAGDSYSSALGTCPVKSV